MQVAIKNRWTGAVVFTAELEAEFDNKTTSAQMGATIKLAFKAGANLSGADLSRADLSGANLSGADLSRANLYGADLSGANLYGADLSRANLYGADLSGASLSGANLSGADLSRANLSGADLSGANLYGATYGEGIPLTKEPIQIFGLQYSLFFFDTHIKIGCKLYLVAEWEGFTDEEIVQMDGSRALKWWREWKDVVLSIAKKHQGKGHEKDAQSV